MAASSCERPTLSLAGQLLTEARTAWQSSLSITSGVELAADYMRYSRDEDLRGRALTPEAVSFRSRLTDRLFASLPPSVIATKGYVMPRRVIRRFAPVLGRPPRPARVESRVEGLQVEGGVCRFRGARSPVEESACGSSPAGREYGPTRTLRRSGAIGIAWRNRRQTSRRGRWRIA